MHIQLARGLVTAGYRRVTPALKQSIQMLSRVVLYFILSKKGPKMNHLIHSSLHARSIGVPGLHIDPVVICCNQVFAEHYVMPFGWQP